MARIFTEGFEMGDVLGAAFITGTVGVSTTYKRTGVYSGMLKNNDGGLNFSVGELSEGYVRVAAFFKNCPIKIHFKSGETILAYFESSLSSYPETPNGGKIVIGSTTVATVTTPHGYETWRLYEVYYKIDDTLGEFIVKVNGKIYLSYFGDTKPSTQTTFNTVYIKENGVSDYLYIDDIAINDTTGEEDNSWCGDGHIIAIKPNANGDSSQLMGSDEDQVDNYLLVDDIPSDGDDTYVGGAIVNDYDLYHIENPELSNVEIQRVWASCEARDTTTKNGRIVLMLKTHDTEYDEDENALSLVYDQYSGQAHTINPYTLLPWTITELENLQVGVKIKA